MHTRKLARFCLPLLCIAAALNAAFAQTMPKPLETATTPSTASRPEAPPHTLLVAVDQRHTVSLDGAWHFIVDPYQGGLGVYQRDQTPQPGRLQEYDFATSPTLAVPGDWNTQRLELMKYEGALWYERHFDYQPQPGTRSFLHLGAANYKALAYINGQLLCSHEGGFTPFDCEATSALKPGDNSVVIFVDDTRMADGVPTLKTDWYNYGGLTRDVLLVTVPAAFIDDFELHLDRATRSRISGYVHVEGTTAGMPVAVEIPELKVSVQATTDAAGRAEISFTPTGLELWSPQTPRLYRVTLRSGQDALTDTMGFKTVETRGSEILLNGTPIVLNGVCIHAEAPYRTGRVDNDQDVATLFRWVKDLGANYVRLAHYPHDERMTRAADRLGILVWSEVPVYWAEHFEDPAVFAKSRQQLGEEIRRDRDKASVILWSIANETPNNPTRTDFLTRSASFVHQQDPTRLVTAALLVHGDAGGTKYIDDPLGKALDVIGFNEYIGWYEKTPEAADTTEWKISEDKPLIVSEFGGGAKAGRHGPATQRWTEEFQAEIYRHQVGMLHRIPQLRGSTAWVLMDFRSPVRQLPGIQDGFNRKGLVSDQGEKKQAFYVLKKAYEQNAVGHTE